MVQSEFDVVCGESSQIYPRELPDGRTRRQEIKSCVQKFFCTFFIILARLGLSFLLSTGRPIVDAIFAWMRECLHRAGAAGQSQLTKALAYAHKRRARWRCFSQIRTCQSTPTASNGHCSRYGCWPGNKLVVHLDRAGRPASRCCPESDRDLSAARHGLLRLSRRRLPARRPGCGSRTMERHYCTLTSQGAPHSKNAAAAWCRCRINWFA